MRSTILLAGGVLAMVISASVAGDVLNWGGAGAIRSLASTASLKMLLVEAPQIATSFPPFGTILLASLGTAVLLASGLLDVVTAGLSNRLPRAWLSPAVFAIGLVAHQISDALLVVYLPFCARAFSGAGRDPVVGLGLGFASFSGALYAGFGPGLQELVLLKMTQAAAVSLDPAFTFNPLSNWYFCLVNALLMTGLAWWVTDRLIEPWWRGRSRGEEVGQPLAAPVGPAGENVRRGLLAAAGTLVAGLALIVLLVAFPDISPLRDEAAEGLARLTPAFQAGAALLTLLTTAVGAAYGLASGRWGGGGQVSDSFNEGVASLAPFLLMAVGIAFLIRMLDYSGLDEVTVQALTDRVTATQNAAPALVVSLAAASAGLDFIVFSASAKWAIMAPSVVPAFQSAGITPELTTAAFRVGDAVVNILNPLQPAAVLVRLLIIQSGARIGTLGFLRMMSTYAAGFAVVGLGTLILWCLFGWPVGPG